MIAGFPNCDSCRSEVLSSAVFVAEGNCGATCENRTHRAKTSSFSIYQV